MVNSGDNFVMADAIRVERINGVDIPSQGIVLEPEIRIVAAADGQKLNDGFGVQDFGTTVEGEPVVLTYEIQNTGLADLENLAVTNVPAGFTAAITGTLPVAARKFWTTVAPLSVSSMLMVAALASRMLVVALSATWLVLALVTLITPSVMVPPDWPLSKLTSLKLLSASILAPS